MCAGKIGNPFHTKQEKRNSCCNQEGRRGSNVVVRGTWVLPSSEACLLGNFGGAIMGVGLVACVGCVRVCAVKVFEGLGPPLCYSMH